MKIINTGATTETVPVFMLLYGSGGIGKSTFSSTAPGAFMADCENGSKYFGHRGIKMPVALIETWTDFAGTDGFIEKSLSNPKVLTVVVDPIGELMEKCKRGLTGQGYIDASGQPTLRGWGELGNRMRTQLRKLRDSGKNVILIAHVEEKEDEGRLVKRPKIQTKLSEDVVNMVDIVAYMYAKKLEDGSTERVITVDPTNEKIVAKDRTGSLPPSLPPLFSAITEAIGVTSLAAPKDPTKEETTPEPTTVEVLKEKLSKARGTNGNK